MTNNPPVIKGQRLRIQRKGEPDVVVIVDDVRRSKDGGWSLTTHPEGLELPEVSPLYPADDD